MLPKAERTALYVAFKARAAEVQTFDWRTKITFAPKDGEVMSPELQAKYDEDCKTLDAYFAGFAKVEKACPCCTISFTYDWGLQRGEAFCVECGYPVRVFHEKVGPIRLFTYPLYYHPNEIELKA